jgi:hypothetical protein
VANVRNSDQVLLNAGQGQVKVGIVPSKRVVGSYRHDGLIELLCPPSSQLLDVWLVIIATRPVRHNVHRDSEIGAVSPLVKVACLGEVVLEEVNDIAVLDVAVLG